MLCQKENLRNKFTLENLTNDSGVFEGYVLQTTKTPLSFGSFFSFPLSIFFLSHYSRTEKKHKQKAALQGPIALTIDVWSFDNVTPIRRAIPQVTGDRRRFSANWDSETLEPTVHDPTCEKNWQTAETVRARRCPWANLSHRAPNQPLVCSALGRLRRGVQRIDVTGGRPTALPPATRRCATVCHCAVISSCTAQVPYCHARLTPSRSQPTRRARAYKRATTASCRRRDRPTMQTDALYCAAACFHCATLQLGREVYAVV